MKQTDIKRLEKAVEHLQKAEDLLGKTYDSLVDQPTQYFNFGSSGTSQTLSNLVGEMSKDVAYQKGYIKGKIGVFKEEFLNEGGKS